MPFSFKKVFYKTHIFFLSVKSESLECKSFSGFQKSKKGSFLYKKSWKASQPYNVTNNIVAAPVQFSFSFSPLFCIPFLPISSSSFFFFFLLDYINFITSKQKIHLTSLSLVLIYFTSLTHLFTFALLVFLKKVSFWPENITEKCS